MTLYCTSDCHVTRPPADMSGHSGAPPPHTPPCQHTQQAPAERNTSHDLHMIGEMNVYQTTPTPHMRERWGCSMVVQKFIEWYLGELTALPLQRGLLLFCTDLTNDRPFQALTGHLV